MEAILSIVVKLSPVISNYSYCEVLKKQSLTHLAQQWSPLHSSHFWDRNPCEKQNQVPPAWYQLQNRRSQWNKALSSPNGPNDKETDKMIKQNKWSDLIFRVSIVSKSTQPRETISTVFSSYDALFEICLICV